MARIPIAVRPLLAAGSLLAISVAALAELEQVSLERLKFERKCVFEVPEWKGKGAEELFLERLQGQRAAYEAKQDARLRELVDLLVEILWSKHEEFVGKGDHDKGAEYADRVLKAGQSDKKENLGGDVTKDRLVKADTYVVERKFGAAQKAVAEGRMDEAKAAYRTLLNSSKSAEALAAIIGIVRKETDFDRSQNEGDVEDQIAALDKYATALETALASADFPEIRDAREKKAKLEGNTQRATVTFKDTSADVAGVKVGSPISLDKETALFTFTPIGDGSPFPASGKPAKFPAKGSVRLTRGIYTVRVFAPGVDKAIAVYPAQALGDSPLEVVVPTQYPEGMVYCPPKVPGGEKFFIDRFEVTVEQVEAVKAAELGDVVKETKRGLDDPRGMPAWFYDEGVARAYEKASGKRIPTVQQWLQAAFAAGDSKYPWGPEEPDASRAFVDPEGAGAPLKAGGRERGASPYGIEDMAGNLAEWVRFGSGDSLWIIGGHNMMKLEELGSLAGESPLRKPMPGHEAYTAMDGQAKGPWLNYRYKNGPNDGSPFTSGLRMVVPVK